MRPKLTSPATFLIAALLIWTGTSVAVISAQPAPARPNIVLIFPDNLGWGEVGVFGGVRGTNITPPRAVTTR